MERLGDLTGSDTAQTGPPPPSPADRPGKVIGGVAGTIADRLGVDPLWVRLGFVVLGLAGGIGVVVYGAWWLILAGGPNSRAMRIAGGALLVAVVPWLIADGPQSFVTGPFAVILLLAGLALALWQPRGAPAPPAPAPTGFPPPVAHPDASMAPAAAQATGAAPASAGWPAAPGEFDGPWQLVADGMQPRADAAATLRPPRERSPLGRITLFVAVYLAAAWALADQIDGGRLHPEQWFGAAAIVCGAGMVVGMVVGRARWLIVPAVLAAGVGYVGGTMARLGIASRDLAGDRYVSVGSYTAAREIDERVGLGELQITVDSAPTAPVHVDARVALGRIQLHVPADVTVELRPRLDHGSITSNQGLTLSETAPTLIGEGPRADVVVDAWVGVGDIDVTVFDIADPDGPAALPTLPGDDPTALLPEAAGALVPIRDGIQMTADGWVVLGAGEAVIGPDDEVTSAQDVTYPEADGTQTINTGWGAFRLLPRSLLLTPDGQVLDLQALRAEVTAASEAPPASTGPPPPAGAPPVSTTTIPGG